jgi:hypothetical protein
MTLDSEMNSLTHHQVLQDGYFMLSIDGSGVEDGSDWFCYHSSSRLIFPINFCKLNHIPLSPPIGRLDFLVRVKNIHLVLSS